MPSLLSYFIVTQCNAMEAIYEKARMRGAVIVPVTSCMIVFVCRCVVKIIIF